jgi:hypothetical protein
MTGPFTPILQLFFFLISMLSSYQRKEYFRAMVRYLSPLTKDQKALVKKAKREAKQAFQPRRIALGRGKYRLAEQGELGGSRYQIYNTTMEDLSGFGSHICGYFLHLKGLVALCLCLTCVNLPSAMYFDSEEYGGPKTSTLGARYFATRGSAVCEPVEGEYFDPLTNTTVVTFRNDHCPYRNKMGVLGIIGVTGVAIFVMLMRIRLERTMVALDESQQTAQDYSIVVEDPNEDALGESSVFQIHIVSLYRTCSDVPFHTSFVLPTSNKTVGSCLGRSRRVVSPFLTVRRGRRCHCSYQQW